jgi:muconolactone delta-isomerase
MEFLVEKTTQLPDDLDVARWATLRSAETQVIGELMASGALRRLWRSEDGARTITIGLWEARDETELAQLLHRLPLRPWMSVLVRPLTQHANELRYQENSAIGKNGGDTGQLGTQFDDGTSCAELSRPRRWRNC